MKPMADSTRLRIPSHVPRAGSASRLGAITVAAGLLLARSAGASASYSPALQDALDLPCSPPCTLCHRSREGGYGTVRLEDGGPVFGHTMMETGGLSAGNTASLRTALAAVEAAAVDSDGDSIRDVDELREARDPNTPGVGELCGIRYGCGARVAPSRIERPAVPQVVLPLLVVEVLLLAARRRPIRRIRTDGGRGRAAVLATSRVHRRIVRKSADYES